MNFTPNILVVDRVIVSANKATVDKWAEAAKTDRDNAQFGMALLHAELQRKISYSLREMNPDSFYQPEIFWADYGPLSISGFLYIEAEESDTHIVGDHHYLCHLDAIRQTAESMGHTVIVQRVKAQEPIDKILIPAIYA